MIQSNQIQKYPLFEREYKFLMDIKKEATRKRTNFDKAFQEFLKLWKYYKNMRAFRR